MRMSKCHKIYKKIEGIVENSCIRIHTHMGASNFLLDCVKLAHT